VTATRTERSARLGQRHRPWARATATNEKTASDRPQDFRDSIRCGSPWVWAGIRRRAV
jgi:hypothetical protein